MCLILMQTCWQKVIEMTGIDDVDQESESPKEMTSEGEKTSGKSAGQERDLFSQYSSRDLPEEQYWGGQDQEQIASIYGLQAGAGARNPQVFNPIMKAEVNVPGLSVRQIQKDIEKEGSERTCCVQKKRRYKK